MAAQFVLAMLDRILDTMFPDATVTVHLFDNSHGFTYDTILTDLNEASFAVYAAQTVALFTSAANAGAGQEAKGAVASVVFQWADSSPATVFGYYLTDGAGNLIGGETFASPLVFDALHPTMTVDVTVFDINFF